jgi:hypothetical protein
MTFYVEKARRQEKGRRIGITHFVENHFVEKRKVDQKISGDHFVERYRWRFGMIPILLIPMVCEGTPEVLRDERMD